MAFEMEFTDQYGDVFTESYWKVAQTNMCQADKTGYVQFQGFENEAKKGKRIIGERGYPISNADYLTYFDADVLNPEGKNPVLAAYIFAKAKKDIGEGEDAVSFFENALDV